MGEPGSTISLSSSLSIDSRTVSAYNSIELFAGAGGMALGMEKAGFSHLLLNDVDRYATATLKKNRPSWHVICGDIAEIDFTPYQDKVDLLTGGFPCQAFSYAGKKRGLEDTKEEYADEVNFEWPKPDNKIYTLKDALKKGELFACDVPPSAGQSYPPKKREILDLVPPGGYWRDLPLELQKSYMMKSFYLGGGKTGIARRIACDEPCLTLTCSPAQKQTERCHPEETRPFTVREYARIQTFPDSWEFEGSISQQYKQIGNAVPVNLAYALGKSLVKMLDQIALLSEMKYNELF